MVLSLPRLHHGERPDGNNADLKTPRWAPRAHQVLIVLSLQPRAIARPPEIVGARRALIANARQRNSLPHPAAQVTRR